MEKIVLVIPGIGRGIDEDSKEKLMVIVMVTVMVTVMTDKREESRHDETRREIA